MIENILYTLMIAVAGWLLYQAGYKDGYDRGWKNGFGACLSTEDDRQEIYIDHDHGGENN